MELIQRSVKSARYIGPRGWYSICTWGVPGVSILLTQSTLHSDKKLGCRGRGCGIVCVPGFKSY